MLLIHPRAGTLLPCRAAACLRSTHKETRHEGIVPCRTTRPVHTVTALAFMQGRLNKLPAKVAAPIRDLVRNELMSATTAETVLEAYEMTGEPQHLLGFAIALLEFRLAGVPVDDTIGMARRQGRRINLRWGAKRWKAEHNRLARAETLERLNAQNQAYDVQRYARLLPAKWPGYLVRNSRRLGLEGLRQRHCVASCHDRIGNGHCAIAVVFVNRTRWTVEIRWTGVSEAPLQITQMRARHNRAPSPEDRAAIHEHLGIPDSGHPGAGATGPEDPRYLPNLQRLLPILRDRNVERVRVEFAGSGDSGQVEHVSLYPKVPTAGLTVPCELTETRRINGEWQRPRGVQDVPVGVAIEGIAYDYLVDTDVDWYNGEGGQGELVIDVAEGTAHLQVRTNLRESTVAFDRKINIETGQPVQRRNPPRCR